MPLPPKFKFSERQGRVNWRALINTNLEQVADQIDLRQLESLLQNITYAELDRDDFERMGDAHFCKLFRLAQLSIEYLVYTQNYLETLTKSLDAHYKQAFEDSSRHREQQRSLKEENEALRRELKLKTKTLTTYEYLLKLPS